MGGTRVLFYLVGDVVAYQPSPGRGGFTYALGRMPSPPSPIRSWGIRVLKSVLQCAHKRNTKVNTKSITLKYRTLEKLGFQTYQAAVCNKNLKKTLVASKVFIFYTLVFNGLSENIHCTFLHSTSQVIFFVIC